MKNVDASQYDSSMKPVSVDENGCAWYEPFKPPMKLCGFPFYEKDRVYRRMPVNPPKQLPASVDALAWHTAGGQVRFRTDSTSLSVKVKLRQHVNMAHMAMTGQSGFDCYMNIDGAFRFAGAAKFDASLKEYTCRIFTAPGRIMRDLILNFPLYNGVEELLVGLDSGCRVEAPSPFAGKKPVVMYGTSITQGGCASRPGMAFSNILGRRLNLEIINLGFSGSGRAEPSVAKCIAMIADPLLFVMDCDANYTDAEMEERLPVFLDFMRGTFPDMPILVLSRTLFAKDAFDRESSGHREKRAAFHREQVEKRRTAGDRRIFFHDGGTLLGDYWDESTVDGGHPTDLGFMHIADALEPVLRKILDLQQ